MIPKIIHYVWCGSALPDAYRAYIDSWQEHNPDWQLMFWNEDNIDFAGVPVLDELYRTKKFNKVSDVVRHLALVQWGGVYLDTDIQMFRSLDRIRNYACFYGFQDGIEPARPSDWIGTSVLGAEPGHWFIRKVLNRMLNIRHSLVGVDIPTAIGPKLITTMLRQEGLTTYSPSGVYVKDIFLCPVHWFYPFGMDEQFTPECIRDDTLAAHFWDRNWEKYTSRSTKILRGVKSIVRHIGVVT